MPRAITEAEYQAWRERTFGSDYMIWHDGLNADAVVQTEGEERRRALEMLSFGLARADSVAVEALGILRETAALPQMRALLPGATGTLRVKTALAIHRLSGGDLSVAPALVEELKASHWGDRLDAAHALALFGEHPAVVPALLGIVRDDPEYLPRYHAGHSLCVIARNRSPDRGMLDDKRLIELVGRNADGHSRSARAHRRQAAETLAALFH